MNISWPHSLKGWGTKVETREVTLTKISFQRTLNNIIFSGSEGRGRKSCCRKNDWSDREGEEGTVRVPSHRGQQKPDEDGESSAPIEAVQEKRKANFELPELVHKLNLLVDLCKQDILSSDRKLAHHKDRVQVKTSVIV